MTLSLTELADSRIGSPAVQTVEVPDLERAPIPTLRALRRAHQPIVEPGAIGTCPGVDLVRAAKPNCAARTVA